MDVYVVEDKCQSLATNNAAVTVEEPESRLGQNVKDILLAVSDGARASNHLRLWCVTWFAIRLSLGTVGVVEHWE